MRAINAQFFVMFAAMGALLPYLSVFLKDRGLSDKEVGYVQAAMAFTGLLSPVIVTLVADLKVSNRRLLGLLLGLSATTAGIMVQLDTFWSLLCAAAMYQLVTQPKNPLLDVLYFREFDHLKAQGGNPPQYHKVRVWGTIGFIMPSLALVFLLKDKDDVALAMIAVAVMNLLAMLNTFLLPAPRDEPDTAHAHAAGDAPDAADAHEEVIASPDEDNRPLPAVRPAAQRRRMPTLSAARALMGPRLLPFCVAIFLAHIASAVYYTFYSLYLTDVVHIEKQYIGPIFSLGVLLEIGFMLGYGWMITRFSLRGLVIVATAALVVRMAVLALLPYPAVAVGSQVFHGLTVLLVHVVPPLWINRHADESNRNSIQGLFVMIVWGAGRITGNLLGGFASEYSTQLAFGVAAVFSVVALVIFIVFFPKDEPAPPRAAT